MPNKITEFWGRRWRVRDHVCDTGVTYICGKIRVTIRRHFDSRTPEDKTCEASLTMDEWAIVKGPERLSDEEALEALEARLQLLQPL